MYRRILVPIDGSQTSERALQEAIKLAGGDAQLRLIHVLEEMYLLDADGYAYIDLASVQEAMRKNGEHLLEAAAKKVRHSGATAETAVLDASGERPANVIENDARQWQADLIVVGTHGRSGLNRLLLGSVAEGVARVASRPVLLVRAE